MRHALVVALLVGMVSTVEAQTDKTPNLATAAWSVDRFAPQVFTLGNGIDGRNNVISIGVTPSGYQGSGSFYDYQGMTTPIDPVGTIPSASQEISMDLFVPAAFGSLTNGFVSTSLWSRVDQVNSDDESTAWYPIVDFTNVNGSGEFRYWNSTLGWQDLFAPVNYDQWNTLAISYDNGTFTAIINGVGAYTEVADAGTVRISAAFLEDYNDGTNGYTAEWSNTPDASSVTPEPATMSLMAMGLVGLVGMKRRKQ